MLSACFQRIMAVYYVRTASTVTQKAEFNEQYFKDPVHNAQ